MSKVARNSVRDRRKCFEAHRKQDAMGVYMECHLCGRRISVPREEWDADHVIPHAIGGTDLAPAHTACHAAKTKVDVSAIAKTKRISDRHFGVKQSGSMPGSRRSGWKKKMNGEWERR